MLAELRAIVSSGMMDPDVYADLHDKATGMAIHTVADNDDDPAPKSKTSRPTAAKKRKKRDAQPLSDGLASIAEKRGGVPDWWNTGPAVALQDATAPKRRNG